MKMNSYSVGLCKNCGKKLQGDWKVCPYCATLIVTKGVFTDSRDGQKYKTVKIGSQIWLAENLKYKVSNSKCCDNKSENVKKYGRLYDWATAIKSCPKGWHLPTNAEWSTLFRFVDGNRGIKGIYNSRTAGKIKAKKAWEGCNGSDDYGFSALPGGYGYPDNDFLGSGLNGRWWSASEKTNIYAYIIDMYYSKDSIRYYDYDKTYLFSVRCVLG